MSNRLLASGVALLLTVGVVACTSTAATPSPTPSSGGGGAAQSTPASIPPGPSTGRPAASASGLAKGPAPDPCTLLTQAQVAGVVGYAVQAGVPGDSHGCAFKYHGTGDLDLLEATVYDNVAVSQVTKDCQATSANGMTITPVSGVGDVACFVAAGILGSHITFAKGGLGFEVSILAFGQLQAAFTIPTAEGMEKALALDVVAKF